MNIQGRLLSAGSPMNGSHPAIFKIYDDPTAGSLLWTESSSLIATGGVFTSTLGVATPIPTSVFDNQPRWLEVTVDGNILSPRLPLTTSAYAFRAQRADTANVALNGALTGGQWETNGTDVWRSSGHVSVGTSSAEAPLTVYGELMNPANALVLRNINPGGGPMAFSIGATGANIPAGVYGIGDENDLRLAINRTNGRVGIGTTSPRDMLEVLGGSAADYFNTSGAIIGNGGIYANLDDNHLGFYGTYGYSVGDEYIDFQSQFNPNVGGQGSLAKITANRNPEDYDLGRGRIKLSVRNGSSLTDMLVADYQGVSIPGNLNVGGTKCRVVNTDFGQVKMNAAESGHALFMDDEPTARLVNGKCRVNLSPKFMATVTVNGKYPLAVNITVYGRHGEWYVERDATGFSVIDPAGGNNEFSWQVIARQRGYEDIYLDPVDTKTAAK